MLLRRTHDGNNVKLLLYIWHILAACGNARNDVKLSFLKLQMQTRLSLVGNDKKLFFHRRHNVSASSIRTWFMLNHQRRLNMSEIDFNVPTTLGPSVNIINYNSGYNATHPQLTSIQIDVKLLKSFLQSVQDDSNLPILL